MVNSAADRAREMLPVDVSVGHLHEPQFHVGDAREVLRTFADASIDFCMTSPPYWGQRQYAEMGIGMEMDYRDYVDRLCEIFAEVRRVLKPTGSFWLNIGDAYVRKSLVGLPWRIAFQMIDFQGWLLRNDVIWHKVKGGPDNSKDKLRNTYEHVFHFVKSSKYYYDVDAIRSEKNAGPQRRGGVGDRRLGHTLPAADRTVHGTVATGKAGGTDGVTGNARSGAPRRHRRFSHDHPRPPASHTFRFHQSFRAR